MGTKIEWCQETWNPISGCSRISDGCDHCYAERMSRRLAGRYGYPKDDPFKVTAHPERFSQPNHWNKPRMIFVCSMGDLFHEDVDSWWIDDIIDACIQAPQHTYLFLTKRPQNIIPKIQNSTPRQCEFMATKAWIGVTAENQKRSDERIPILLQIPAAVRFVSVEPMIGPVEIKKYLGTIHEDDLMMTNPFQGSTPFHDPWFSGIDWVICGGESGPNSRPIHPYWVLSLRDQCANAGVPFFFKQWGDWEPVGPLYDRTEVEEDRWADERGKRELIYPTGQCCDPYFQPGPDAYLVERVGKKHAGREIDGKLWEQYPGVK